jgi:hypothetical protein
MFTLLIGNLKLIDSYPSSCSTKKATFMHRTISESTAVGDDAKIFLLSLLAENSEDRPTADECLDSQWLC